MYYGLFPGWIMIQTCQINTTYTAHQLWVSGSENDTSKLDDISKMLMTYQIWPTQAGSQGIFKKSTFVVRFAFTQRCGNSLCSLADL